MACFVRRGLGLAGALALLLWSHPAPAQDYGPDDPLPPGAKGKVLELRGKVLEIRGLAAGMNGRTGAVQTALEELGAEVEDKEIKIDLSADVLFDFDKADLRPEAEPSLRRIVEVLQAYPDASALIEGHTDAKGSESYNQALSQRRAESVWRWLVDAGVTTEITTRGWGESRPVAPNAKPDGSDDPEGRQRNRRVEITVRTE